MRGVTWCALLVIAAGLAAERMHAQPVVSNARAEIVEVRGNLSSTLTGLIERSTGPMWIAWQEPAASRVDACCWHDECRGCRLEPTPAGTVAPSSAVSSGAAPLALEGDATLVVLVRVDGRQLDRLRIVGASCPLDAGGLPFTTLTGVPAAESLAWLRALVDRTDPSRPRRLADAAIQAIARHADPGAVPMLLDLARRHTEPHARGSALVALAQVAGRRIAPELTSAIDRDPDTEVKKRAVFALSQLPKDEGVPLLIQVAREHRNTAVRRQAMFWLGQSKDARAIEFFASVLRD
jgi:hypothetical protein